MLEMSGSASDQRSIALHKFQLSLATDEPHPRFYKRFDTWWRMYQDFQNCGASDEFEQLQLEPHKPDPKREWEKKLYQARVILRSIKEEQLSLEDQHHAGGSNTDLMSDFSS